MKALDIEFIKGFVRLMDDGSRKGWHERNGGNLSYRMKDEDVQEIKSHFKYGDAWRPINTVVESLRNEYFLVTGTGKFMRNAKIKTEETIGIIEVDDLGENYRILWGLIGGNKPTSEIPTHLLNHAIKKRVTHDAHRVIYHAHTTNIIALTFVLPLDNDIFTRELWEMATECPVVFPDGVGVVPWMVPGGEAIGVETSKLMEKYNVAIWAHHGTFCSGDDFDSTFGLMDTVEKAAEILVKVLSITPKKRQTITTENFQDLAKAFHVTLNEDALKK